MATTLILLCAAATRSSRTGGFPAFDEPLDEAGRRAATSVRLEDRFRARVRLSPSLAAVETAAAMRLDGREEIALGDIDHGEWAGRAFEAVHTDAPTELARWLIDPTQAVPGGEAMRGVEDRVGAWLDAVSREDAPICAITHATVIRAALAHALRMPLRTTLAIDIAPLSHTLLSFHNTWRLQALGPAT
ncbi:MAG: histidine phosphatase family protein [Nocardioides sp.]